MCHSGPEKEARADLERLRSFGAPDAADLMAEPFRDMHFVLIRADRTPAPPTPLADDQVEIVKKMTPTGVIVRGEGSGAAKKSD